MAVRTNTDGLLEILHPETGAYVSATALLQTEGGLLTSLVPAQVALISDIRNASAYLEYINSELTAIRTELISSENKITQSNVFLNQVNESLANVNEAIDSLESLNAAANALLETVRSSLVQVSEKLPGSLGAKARDASLSVALASDSTVFSSLNDILAALSASGSSIATLTAALSAKIPSSVGAKTVTNSLSVALASDSTIFTSLNSISTALLDNSSNSVGVLLAALSAKFPGSVGAKTNASSLSVALASDSTIFASLVSILAALSDGGSNSALSYLATVAGAQFWKAPTKINSASPIINAATAATSSAAYTINSQTTAISLQNFFSAVGLSAQFAIEMRVTAGASSLSDKHYYYQGDVATPFLASAGAYPGEGPILIPTHGFAQVVVNLSAIAGGGNVTTYAKEIR